MPIPMPEAGESHEDFTGRCMAELEGEFPDAAQRAAVCERQWDEGKGAMTTHETKHLGPLAVTIKDAAKGEIEAVFSTFNVRDHDGDWTEPGAFTDGAKVRISAYGHESWSGALPVGKGVIRTTAQDARLVGQFFLSTTHGRETFETVKEMGELQQWSYGFDVIERAEPSDELRTQGVWRVLKKLLVHEVSPVLVGAGVATRTLSVKARADEAAVAALRAKALVEVARFERTRARLHAGFRSLNT